MLRTDYPIMYFSIQIRVSKSLLIITHNTRGIDLFYHWSFLCIYHDWQLSERHCCYVSLRLALPKNLEWQTLSRRAVYISSFCFYFKYIYIFFPLHSLCYTNTSKSKPVWLVSRNSSSIVIYYAGLICFYFFSFIIENKNYIKCILSCLY